MSELEGGIKSLFEKKTKYLILVSDGQVVRACPVIERSSYNEGFAMRYKDHEGKMDVVYMSREYRPLELQPGGKLLIGKRIGNNSACKVVVDGLSMVKADDVVGPSTDKDCPGEDLSCLVRTDVMARGYSTLSESKVPWKWVIIIGIIAVVVIAIFYFKSRGG